MRTIKQLNVPKEQDLNKFPDSTILNETDTIDGTPVVREIYGDLLTNWYAYLRDRGIIANGVEDNEINGYQLIEALKLNVNTLNDIRQTLRVVDSSTFELDIDFKLLTTDYPIFVRSTETINIEGIGKGVYYLHYYLQDSKGVKKIINFTQSVNSGDELLFIISNDVKAINLIQNGSSTKNNETEVNIQGIPLSYSTSKLSDYLDGNTLIYNDGTSIDLNTYLQAGFVVKDVVLINDAYLVFGIESVSKKLRLYKYFRGENTVTEILIQNINDNNQEVEMNTAKVMMYVYKNKIAFTRRAGKVFSPYLLYMYDYDNTNLLKFNSEIELDTSFNGTSNYIMNDEGIIISKTTESRLRMYTFNKQERNVYILKENVVNIFTKNTNDRFIQVGETAILWK